MLDKNSFSFLIQHAPLISIDLLVFNAKDEVLLGKRKNEPAKGYWFAPGGRVLKDEKLSDAFSRISKNELGIKLKLNSCQFLGIYEHFYDDNFFNDKFSTHYVALTFVVKKESLGTLPESQHSEFRWFKTVELLSDALVHENTKNYFMITKGIK